MGNKENRIKIRLTDVECLGKFINKCSKYEDNDINVYSGRFVLDGKSIIGVMSAGIEKTMEVEILTDSISLRDKFAEDMKEFEVECE